MKSFSLEGSLRNDLGKKASKTLRKEDLIPAVIYGGENNTNFVVSQDNVRKLVYSPEIFHIDLTIDGKATKAILKDMQFHPVTDEIMHIDFLEISEDKPIVMEVPVVLEGHAEGVKAGGKLSLEMRKLKVKAPYTQIPEQLQINVSHLGLGKTIQVGALSFDGLEIVNAKNAVVCAVKLTRAARGAMAKGK
ncbi:50S ribosomal protein L25/general stress protein Ctc [Porphyromonas pogonae]|uniref:50S ribosomal protein L25/general stress protein Ctc n=1 Tax=Porphyromonas pogonae TaxID=867595 RepID=UPI002E782665|nr:50S ribosomal protein L25/general stress protein Ctc [Porphyromonas pogonae]